MKKTVQIVTIPLDKKGFSINDLIKKPAFDAAGEIERWKISYYGMSTGIWKAHQLLVLSDDEIQKDDRFFDGFNRIDTYNKGEFKPNKNYKKIIASYPHIAGTLSISKEIIQTWIDAGTPKEGVIEMEETEYSKIKQYPKNIKYQEVIDNKGNLIIKFSTVDQEEDIYDAVADYRKNHTKRPAVPTDEEIRKKCGNIANQNTYIAGYKQALKDLGYANN